MKENILGPRQWAFVVITGGAACALPFLQTDNAPTRTDSTSTSSQQDALHGGPRAAPTSLSDVVPPLAEQYLPDPYSAQYRLPGQRPPVQHLPEWAKTDRSPFDDIVGNTLAKPEPAPPQAQVPMQPLRPWIAGPGDAASLVTASSAQRPPIAANPDGAIARAKPSAVEASPWSDATSGFTPIEQLASHNASPPASGPAGGPAPSPRWPDQAVSAEQIAQVTRAHEREPTSAIVGQPQGSLPNASSALLAAPALVSTSPSSTLNAVPAASTQHFGQRSAQADFAPQEAHAAGARANHSNLPPLPATRKSHIIFQPGIRK